jgi:23S rRNA pseudouridine2605 synthase
MGTKADPGRDHIRVDGTLVRPAGRKIYLLLNKPRGVISSVTDPLGRVTVTDLVKSKGRIFHVGRLDYNSEGLIILTNDGELARIMSRAGGVFPKVYHVKVRSVPDDVDLNRLRAGIRLPDGTRLTGAQIELIRRGRNTWFEVILVQGKNQQIRRMFAAIGHPVAKLQRRRIGFLTDRGLPVGSYRCLTPEEVTQIFRLSHEAMSANRQDSSGKILGDKAASEACKRDLRKPQRHGLIGGMVVHRHY